MSSPRNKNNAALLALVMTAAMAQADHIYVSNEASNVVHILDGANSALLADIAVGRRPRGMALSADGSTLYVAVSDDNRIDVVDVGQRRVRGHLPSGIDPEL